MQILDCKFRNLPISRYADASISPGGLTTTIVALHTDQRRNGKLVVGYGFASIGRFGQSGLMAERFAPRLLGADVRALLNDQETNFDPLRVWSAMMAGEKPGGHGERCVAVGALDMAIWDACAKIAERPLYAFIQSLFPQSGTQSLEVPLYAGGGYPYPQDDETRLADEIGRMKMMGYQRFKIKVGGTDIGRDLRRIAVAVREAGDAGKVAVDAMNSYDAATALRAADAFSPLGLWWFEDVCDPLDFETQKRVAERYPGRIAAGEALFSSSEALLLHRFSGLRPGKDILLFDPVHCYGLTGFLRIMDLLLGLGWQRSDFWPHGGHLFSLHLCAALRLGGSEMNPLSFAPFGGLHDDAVLSDGCATPPNMPGIGFESKGDLFTLFRELA